MGGEARVGREGAWGGGSDPPEPAGSSRILATKSRAFEGVSVSGRARCVSLAWRLRALGMSQ